MARVARLSRSLSRMILIGGLALAAAACSDGSGETGSGGDGGAPGSGGSGAATASGGAGGHGGTSGTTSAGGQGGSGGGGMCTDACPAPAGGVEYGCEKRFMHGVNYAWQSFGADFGGIAQWNQPGVAAMADTHAAHLADIRKNGGSVVRWWVFPDLRGDGIDLDANDVPTGLGGTAVADVQKALELAEQADVYLMLCLFSFDAFRPSETSFGLYIPGITPIVTDAQKRQALLEKVVRPLVKAAAASPHAERLISWDVINEPEWAMTGPTPYGDSDYEPSPDLAPVTHAQMETFVAETIGVLRQETSALVTVGGAAMKWGKAWSKVDVDFYQLHIYDWINQYWPYSMSPADYGIDDRPVVMGEFPIAGLTGVSYGQLVGSFYQNGWAGAMGWQYNEASAADLGEMKAFAESHPCETSY